MFAITVIVVIAYSMVNKAVAAHSKSSRILDIRDQVIVEDDLVRLRQIASNPDILSQKEQELVVTHMPQKQAMQLSLIDIAYLLQRYPELLDVKLRGTKRVVTLQRPPNTENLEKAKKAIRAHVAKTEPWKAWETDLVFSTDDDLRILKVGTFDVVEVMPYDNKELIGTVAFRLLFFDEKHRQTGKTIINPTLLKKVEVPVMNTTVAKGRVLKKSDVKTIPMWIGDKKMNYETNIANCIGKELSRKMDVGDIIRSTDILNPTCVKRGDILWINCGKGILNVRIAAVAMESGRLGDVVQVKNKSSQKTFRAELTGPKEAKITIDG